MHNPDRLLAFRPARCGTLRRCRDGPLCPILSSPNSNPAPHRPDTVRGWIVHTIHHEVLQCGIMHQRRNYQHVKGSTG